MLKSELSSRLRIRFDARSAELGIEVFPERRVQVGPTGFRIPDVTVVKISQFQGGIFENPPHLCIEILCKKDTMDYMQEKIDDHLRLGAPFIWIIHPRQRQGYIATKAGMLGDFAPALPG